MKSSNNIHTLFTLNLVLGFSIAAACFSSGVAQNSAQVEGQVTQLIQQAKAEGFTYLNSRDDRAKKIARKSLDEAEKQLKDGSKRDANCRKCIEQLVEVYFYQALFRFSGDYRECLKTADEGLSRFPESGVIAYLKGFVHFYGQQHAESIKAFKRALPAITPNTQTEAQVRQMMSQSQQFLLNSWWKQANFFQSWESRVTAPNYQTNQLVTLFQVTPEYELSLGNQAYNDIVSRSSVLQDPEIQSYLDGLISRLTSQTRGPDLNYRVTVVNTPMINAVTVPGHIFVYTGLLAFCETEEELVGVLAHELAHNYGHHLSRRLIKGYQSQMLANMALKMINPNNQVAMIATSFGAQVAQSLFLLAYNRFEEKEADLYGAHIMFNAGYNPTAMSYNHLKMYKRNPKQPVKFLSTHPPSDDRVNYITEYVESFPLEGKEWRKDSEQFQRIRAKLAGRQPTAQGAPIGLGN